KKALSVLGQAAGVYLVAASTSRQAALEDQQLGHGVITWSLLEGLKGKADFDSDRAVTIRELVTFVESEVARMSREKVSQEQFPVTHSTGRNFPRAVTPR
ncbi:MAG: putative caspase-like protein, partial [Myxococcota bacterium]